MLFMQLHIGKSAEAFIPEKGGDSANESGDWCRSESAEDFCVLKIIVRI